ncbi:D-glycero-beta-D-manno-heptose 1-phosphate adenylyltransferase [Marivirga arenosa]|uniref:D-glycero-beta-D-manno-heptose 1-phosphate adenylyltransferase n=1 Tax=Marivirga arenosa TaxID=3059076 RepID=A0AA51RDZ0_9BACT|nr:MULTISPECIES: D-glycero-beta-D-manno-heptose 1-phosphate adenylyltransferase [unclassified Marivirga]WMN08045.1 D-glycero-beta-D-manno-heptose 1-phosphate adenylyltransferase [Marivirga sp. ABR2-2]WNB17753.1 D-glycero-beta-D-manno-heptose 1-phosphate adenylyltransferase [Marivirga sp. BKB1-2]
MPTADKIIVKRELLELRNEWKNEKLVFTNGCFDILHLGHVDYLEKAAEKGTKLIVAINTDQSVSKLKGPDRPVNDEYSRCRLIAALAFVDAVILFSEDTPLSLITDIKPDVLVKGNDYTIDNIVGADVVIENGGKVETIELVKGYSTTNIINKLSK